MIEEGTYMNIKAGLCSGGIGPALISGEVSRAGHTPDTAAVAEPRGAGRDGLW